MTGPAYVIPQAEIDERVAARVGGKALALARMARAGIAVPPFVAVTTDAYEAYLDATGLRARILFELERKDFAEMRWEELWDAALRIRSLFLTTPLPEELRAALAQPLAARFAEVATVVRSSAPGEDSAGASFAGLHESYVNVRGVDADPRARQARVGLAVVGRGPALPARAGARPPAQRHGRGGAGDRRRRALGRGLQLSPRERSAGPGGGRARPEPGPRGRRRRARPLDARPSRRRAARTPCRPSVSR